MGVSLTGTDTSDTSDDSRATGWSLDVRPRVVGGPVGLSSASTVFYNTRVLPSISIDDGVLRHCSLAAFAEVLFSSADFCKNFMDTLQFSRIFLVILRDFG